jgi:hypothetical protein
LSSPQPTADNASALPSSAALNQEETRRVILSITSLSGALNGRHCKGCAWR